MATLVSAEQASKLSADISIRDKYLSDEIIEAIDKAIHSGQYEVLLPNEMMMGDYHYVAETLRSLGYRIEDRTRKLDIQESVTEMVVHWPRVNEPERDEVFIYMMQVKRELNSLLNACKVESQFSYAGQMSHTQSQQESSNRTVKMYIGERIRAAATKLKIEL